ncbi:MAG: ATP-binding protein [Cyclobacteriaceae bacterium]
MVSRLINLGVTDELPISQAQVVRSTNLIALFPITVFLFYIGYGIYLQLPIVYILSAIMIVTHLVVLYLNACYHYGLSKFLLITINGLIIWLTYQIFNVDHSVLTTYFPILFAYGFFFNPSREKYYLSGSILLTSLFVVSSFLLPRQLWYGVDLSESQAALSNVVHLGFSFTLCALIVYVIFKNNSGTSKKLIEARKEAERYSRLQTEFLANMSHEIRTPLNGVIGSTELLLDTELDKQQNEYAQTIGLSGRMLLDIISNILDLSKLEANRMSLENVDFDFRSTLEELVQVQKPQIFADELEVQLMISPDIPEAVFGDEKKIRQVLTNLVSNARKFTDEGYISIEASVVGKRGEVIDIAINVRDTGIGIPKEQQDRLFTRFYQADSSTERRFMGTGLGLVISKNLVVLMGGSIKARSVEGEGSVFSVLLPLRYGKQPKAAPKQRVRNEVSNLNVLVAEDNDINQMVISKILTNMKHKVDVASNGLEAYELAVREDYDLILMDVQMPKQDGIVTTRQIRSKLGEQKPIIAALTASAMKEDQDRCLAAGMNAYLSKPVRKQDISNLISDWFS